MDTTASSKPEFSKLDQEINTDRLIHMPDNASLSKQKRVAQHRVLSLAPRRVAVVGPSRECACLADDADPSSCRSRAQPRPQSGTASQCSTVWVCSRVESRLARCILVWDVISLSCASLALSYESKSPGLVGPDPGTGPGQHGPQPGASESSELHCPGWTCPQASSPGRHRPRPSAPESQELVERVAARNVADLCAGCNHGNLRNAQAVRPGPGRLAGRSITEGGWVRGTCLPCRNARACARFGACTDRQ